MPISGLSTKFTFQSSALEPDTFRVMDFRGEEEISRLSRYEINLVSDLPDIDMQAVLEKPAFLGLEREGELEKIHGIISEFEQREKDAVHVHYRAVLVPRLWKLTLRQQNQVHQEQTVGEIIEQELKDAGLTSKDFEVTLKESHPKREYVVQYQESDFAFLSRLAEHEGIFFYFVHDDERDKVVFADKNEKFVPIEGEASVPYRPPAGIAESDKESVLGLICRQQRVPKEVILKDYNWRTPSLDLTVKTTVDPKGDGLFCEYGDHYKDKDGEGANLARLRAEEIRCRQKLFHGEGNVLRFRAGGRFKLDGHYRTDFNQELLLHQVTHSGSQLSAGPAGTSAQQAEKPVYRNTFVGAASDMPFRPERLTPRPRIVGSINARIDAGGDGKYAEIDDQGRYKVALPFDQKVKNLADMSGGKGSRWVRKAEPYSGEGFGFHFPLHKGAEVLLTHIGGDPDRPIIALAVPNVETGSPVTSENQTRSVIRTGSGNQIHLEDKEGGELIKLHSPHENSFLRIGATNQLPPGINMGTNGHLYTNVGGHEVKKVDGNWQTTIEGTKTEVVTGEVKRTHHSNSHSIVTGNALEEFKGNKKSITSGTSESITNGDSKSKTDGNTQEEFFGTKASTCYALTDELFIGVKSSKCVAATNDLFAGAKLSNSLAASVDNYLGIKLTSCAALNWEKSNAKNRWEAPINEIEGKGAILLKVGGSNIWIDPGEIVIKAPEITLDSPITKVTGKLSVESDIHGKAELILVGKVHAENVEG